MTHRGQAAGIGLFACLLLTLGGCASQRPLIESSSVRVELAATPFYPQRRFQCGPAALATVLGASGVRVTPEELEPLVYLPGRKGSLAIEMGAAPRRYGRLAYGIEPELAAVARELDAGRPVLVLHNYGLPFWPRWHYAVVIGYDGTRDELLLRSGTVRREVWTSRNFMRAWDNADRWALVLLKPGELPVAPDKERYLEAAAAFEKAAEPKEAWRAFDAAVRTWPEEPVAWMGRGTASYREKDFRQAAQDYSAALRRADSLVGARNNLVMALLEMGCVRAARQELEKIEVETLSGAMREAVEDTRRQAAQRSDTSACPEPER